MKLTKQITLTLAVVAFAGLTIPTIHAADQTEAELMAQAKISKTQAEKIAMAKVPNAKIQSEEIENEHHALVWSFDMVKDGSKNVTEVLVNAKTGKIVDVSTESPSDQAKEKATDKANGQK
jgi:uncharacterized membrane protein YkoI